MSETPYPVGYGRPPVHTRFQKGQSGNPGGKPKPRTGAKHAFDMAVEDTINADRKALQESRPTKLIEAFLRRMALDAVDGEPTAQRLLVSILERGDRATAGEVRQPALTSEERTRELLGDRYDEFSARFSQAVATGNGAELLALARECEDASKFPQSGNS